jgi:hypothetical protein
MDYRTATIDGRNAAGSSFDTGAVLVLTARQYEARKHATHAERGIAPKKVLCLLGTAKLQDGTPGFKVEVQAGSIFFKKGDAPQGA